jgi:hypothetical protein
MRGRLCVGDVLLKKYRNRRERAFWLNYLTPTHYAKDAVSHNVHHELQLDLKPRSVIEGVRKESGLVACSEVSTMHMFRAQQCCIFQVHGHQSRHLGLETESSRSCHFSRYDGIIASWQL